MEQPRVICTASDKYLPALRVYLHQMNKYWVPNPQIIVAGFSDPSYELPKNVQFVSIGKQESYPFKRWSNALLDFLEHIDDEVFVLMLEDYFLVRHVDTRAIKILYDYMLQFKYVAKIDLCGDRLYAHGADLDYGQVAYLDIVKSMPGSPYHLSLMTGLWRKEHLVRNMALNESPHDLELIGTTRLSHDQNVIVLGTRQWPVRHILGLRANDPSILDLRGMLKSDAEELDNLGYLDYWRQNE